MTRETNTEDWFPIFVRFAMEAKESSDTLPLEMIGWRIVFHLQVESRLSANPFVSRELLRNWASRLERQDPSFAGFFYEEGSDGPGEVSEPTLDADV